MKKLFAIFFAITVIPSFHAHAWVGGPFSNNNLTPEGDDGIYEAVGVAVNNNGIGLYRWGVGNRATAVNYNDGRNGNTGNVQFGAFAGTSNQHVWYFQGNVYYGTCFGTVNSAIGTVNCIGNAATLRALKLLPQEYWLAPGSLSWSPTTPPKNSVIPFSMPKCLADIPGISGTTLPPRIFQEPGESSLAWQLVVAQVSGEEMNSISLSLETGYPSNGMDRDHLTASCAGNRGFTLLEIVVTSAVVLVLIGVSIPVFDKWQEKARKVTCISKMRAIHGALGSAVTEKGEWPQIPTENGEPPQWSQTEFFQFWIDQMEGYGLSREAWVCPSDEVSLLQLKTGDLENFTGSYVPTSFGPGANTPFKWNQPWLVERARLSWQRPTRRDAGRLRNRIRQSLRRKVMIGQRPEAGTYQPTRVEKRRIRSIHLNIWKSE